MITLPWGEGEVREVLTLVNGIARNQRVLVAHIPADSTWPIDVTILGDFTKRAEWLERMALDLIQALAALDGAAPIEEREDDLGEHDVPPAPEGRLGP